MSSAVLGTGNAMVSNKTGFHSNYILRSKSKYTDKYIYNVVYYEGEKGRERG